MRLQKVTRIMTDFEYPGIRIVLEARLDRLKQRIKIDLSTDDVITPSAIDIITGLCLNIGILN